MHVLDVLTVNDALPAGLAYLANEGRRANSRNGAVLVAPGPVATVYKRPTGRVLFDPVRDINPFFHLFEALWIIQGRQDVGFLKLFNSKMAEYSDNGYTFHAAYGHRLRYAQGFDQIEAAVNLLKKDPDSRRAVLQIWDASSDYRDSKDLPCNDMIFLRINEGALDLTVANRSNDVIWGAYGTNAVQFSILQEYIAALLGVGIGTYTQISHNYHVYTDLPYWKQWSQRYSSGGMTHVSGTSLYDFDTTAGGCLPTPIFTDSIDQASRDLNTMFEAFDGSMLYPKQAGYAWVDKLIESNSLKSFTFITTVLPMLNAWAMHKRGKTRNALMYLQGTKDQSCDWIRCSTEWLRRRVEKQNAA